MSGGDSDRVSWVDSILDRSVSYAEDLAEDVRAKKASIEAALEGTLYRDMFYSYVPNFKLHYGESDQFAFDICLGNVVRVGDAFSMMLMINVADALLNIGLVEFSESVFRKWLSRGGFYDLGQSPFLPELFLFDTEDEEVSRRRPVLFPRSDKVLECLNTADFNLIFFEFVSSGFLATKQREASAFEASNEMVEAEETEASASQSLRPAPARDQPPRPNTDRYVQDLTMEPSPPQKTKSKMSHQDLTIDSPTLSPLTTKEFWALLKQMDPFEKVDDFLDVGSLLRLRPEQWLNDKVIDYYAQLIREREKPLSERFGLLTTLTAFQISNGTITEDKSKIIMQNMDLESKSRVFMPTNIGNSHWVLISMNFEEGQIELYDSMVKGYEEERHKLLSVFFKWFEREVEKSDNPDSLDGFHLQVKSNNEIPQQPNGYDCGVFVLRNLELLTKSQKITEESYSEHDIRKMRTEILNAILDKTKWDPRKVLLRKSLSPSRSETLRKKRTPPRDDPAASATMKKRKITVPETVFTTAETVDHETLKTIYESSGLAKNQIEAIKSVDPFKGQWLYDDVINAYFLILMQRNRNSGKEKYYFAPNHLYSYINDNKNNVANLPTIENISDYAKIFIPVNTNRGTHWELIVIDVAKKRITLHNSLQPKNITKTPLHITQVTNWWAEVSKFKDFNWTYSIRTPQQPDSINCGVFVLLVAKIISEGGKIGPTSLRSDQASLFAYRAHILNTILRNSLDPAQPLNIDDFRARPLQFYELKLQGSTA